MQGKVAVFQDNRKRVRLFEYSRNTGFSSKQIKVAVLSEKLRMRRTSFDAG